MQGKEQLLRVQLVLLSLSSISKVVAVCMSSSISAARALVRVFQVCEGPETQLPKVVLSKVSDQPLKEVICLCIS